MLFGYYQKNPDELPADFQAIRLEEGWTGRCATISQG